MGGNYRLEMTGTVGDGTHSSVRMTGVGKSDPASGWIYDYIGYLVPTWPNGVDQVPAIIGSVIRTMPHGPGAAGVVASFIAVRQ
jgi:hypothetical protein